MVNLIINPYILFISMQSIGLSKSEKLAKSVKFPSMEHLELSYVVEEIKSKLLNRYFVKWYPISKIYYRIKFSDAEIGIMLGKGVYITKFLDTPKINSNMCVRANRILKNRRLLDVRLESNDRVIWFDFGTHAIVVEQFGSGNLIFLEKQDNSKKDKDNVATGDKGVNWKILDATTKRTWRTRKILSGELYNLPESRTKPIDQLFVDISNPPDKFRDQPIMIFLMKYAFGKKYYNYVLNGCGLIDSDPPKNIDEIKLLCILKGVRNILDSKQFFRQVIGIAISISSVSEYFDLLYHPLLYSDPKYESLIRRLKAQEEHLESLKQEKEITRKIGDFIYEHYQQIEEILNSVKKSSTNSDLIKKYNIKRLNKLEIETDVPQ